MGLILPVPLSGSACVNSEADAALGEYFQSRTRFCLTFSAFVRSHLHQEVLVMCMRGP